MQCLLLGENLPGVLHIAANLFAQRFEGRELAFIPELLDKGQFEFLPVEVAGEIKKMRLQMQLRLGRGTRGTKAQVDHAAPGLAIKEGMSSVNAIRGQDHARHLEVGGGEPVGSPELIAVLLSMYASTTPRP